MDEVARERAASAHRRLDGINGQIRRLGDEMAVTRETLHGELDATREGIYEVLTPLTNEVASLKTAFKIVGTIALAVLTATLSAVVLLLTRHPQQPTPRKAVHTVGVGKRDQRVADRLASP